jgi:predicted TPR repeat methyltransferase
LPARETGGRRAAVTEALGRAARGGTPPNVALMQLFMAAASEQDARRELTRAIESAEGQAQNGVANLAAMWRLWDETPDAYATIAAVHALTLEPLRGGTKDRIAQLANLFDRAAAISEQAGVALYSLGEPQLLDRATEEIVAFMREQHLLRPSTRVLEIGCGAGRFLSALAPCTGSVTGIDISENMVKSAQMRIAGFLNATAVRGSGYDLSAAGSGPFDLVLAVDSFPYLVDAGVAETHFAECARLLAKDGRVLIFNFSYRGDLDADRADIARLAETFGFSVMRNGTRDFSLWDGATFLLRPSEFS